MPTKLECPMCGGTLVASGEVEDMGLVFVCGDTECRSHSEEHDCEACGGPKVFVRVERASLNGEAGGAEFVLRCFNPLCPNRGETPAEQVVQEG